MSDHRDHSSHEVFSSYYEEKSARPDFVERFRSLQKTITNFLSGRGKGAKLLDVLDVGCNAGTQCMVWAELGHRVHGVEINQPLLEVAKKRAKAIGATIEYKLGSAMQLPWPDHSMDVCLAIELLEHVPQWMDCIREFARVLRPGGVLFITTSNRLCPKQEEFNLPAYSWYPPAVKKHCERLAITNKPELVNYVKYPAVNWFTPYQLTKYLASIGFDTFDRFDLINLEARGPVVRLVVLCIRRMAPLRFFGHVCTQGTILLAQKQER